MTRVLCLAVALAFALPAAAQGADEFTSAGAKAALKKYDKAVKKARTTYLKALDKALKTAMKAYDLEEAQLIDAETKLVEGHGDAKFESAGAKSAQKKFKGDVAKAAKAYKKALEKELKKAMKVGDLEEATRIKGTIDDLTPPRRGWQERPATLAEQGSSDLTTGAKALTNRSYVWKTIPSRFKGWTFTPTTGKGGGNRGKTGARVEFTVTSPGIVYVMTDMSAEKPEALSSEGWKALPQLAFGVSNGKHAVFSKVHKKGKASAPDLGFSGTILLVPPTKPTKRAK